MHMKNDVIALENIYVEYDGQLALCDVNLEIYEGEILGICGPNGSGKTTLLKTMTGLIKPSQGRIRLFGKPFSKEMLNWIGYMPQLRKHDTGFPATVRDVVMMGRYAKLGLFKRPTSTDNQIVDEVLEETHLIEIQKKPIGKLSGGQFQRVMLAHALAKQPKVLLLDEPTSALDFRMTTSFMELLEELNRKYRMTIVAVHHDLQLLKDHATRIVCLDKAVEWIGSPNDANLDEILLRVFFYRTPH